MQEIEICAEPLDVQFHPQLKHNNLALLSTINGHVVVVDASVSSVSFNHQISQESCRSAVWHSAQSSSGFIAAGSDLSWTHFDIEHSKEISCVSSSHENPICKVMSLYENLFASADDEGVVKIWDTRSNECIREYHDNEDYIADFAYLPDKKTLIAAGGDGYLTVLDIRKKELLARSDNFETDLLSVEIIKGGKKVVVGMEDGVLGVFNWGDWGDVKDRILGHPLSIDSMAKYDENTIFTGSSDGIIRVVDIYPTEFCGVLGDQGDFPVERLSISNDQKYIASVSHDKNVRIWDMDSVIPSEEKPEYNDETDSDSDSDDDGHRNLSNDNDDSDKSKSEDERPVKKKQKKSKPAQPLPEGSSFFADLDNDN